MSKQYRYVNLRHYNLSYTDNQPAVLKEQRSNQILPPDLKYKCSVDRWNIEQGVFPVFEVDQGASYTVNIKEKGSGTVESASIDFGSDQFLYNMAEFVSAINTAIASACHDHSISAGDIPVLLYDGVVFFIESNSNFRDPATGFDLGMNAQAFSMLNTFARISGDTLNNPYFLLDDDLVQQPSQTLDQICPVKRIEIQGSLPIYTELLPNTFNSYSGSFSINVENIITDFNFFPETGTHLQSVTYSAGGNHRWATLTSNDFNQIELRIYWLDNKGQKFNVQNAPRKGISVKLAFQELSEIN